MEGNRKREEGKQRKEPTAYVCYEYGCLDPFYVTHGRFSPVIAAAASQQQRTAAALWSVVCGLQSLLCDLAM